MSVNCFFMWMCQLKIQFETKFCCNNNKKKLMGKKRKNILLKYNLFCLVCRLGHKYVKSIVNVESEPESLNSL